MIYCDRRAVLRAAGNSAAAVALGSGVFLFADGYGPSVSIAHENSRRVEKWMNRWMAQAAPAERAEGVLFMGRFIDPVYYLTSPISWRPNPPQSAKYQQVDVPTGFVTDLASIPRVFWSALRPDGKYAHAAVVHDYLYWKQTTPRDVADSILKFEMQDLGIGRATILQIYWAVRAFGRSAWKENAKLKAAGEKRVLKTYPSDPTISWDEWKKRPDVFS